MASSACEIGFHKSTDAIRFTKYHNSDLTLQIDSNGQLCSWMFTKRDIDIPVVNCQFQNINISVLSVYGIYLSKIKYISKPAFLDRNFFRKINWLIKSNKGTTSKQIVVAIMIRFVRVYIADTYINFKYSVSSL